ncbi:cytochrome c maturation protein CcmE, partial [Arthrospira platensis SPKY1]|nr:cytochrome c maturation protein CcmE [Arthrospira platensis SPKY1]
IAVAIGSVIAALINASTYESFDIALAQPGKTFTIIGELDKEGEMNYNARENVFSFYAIDKKGNRQKVHYHQPKPTDFERSEDITMKGYATADAFVATEILLKCPSKYNEQNEMEEGY